MNSHFIRHFLLLISLSQCVAVETLASEITISDNNKHRLAVFEQAWVLEDPTGSLTLDDVKQQVNQFAPVQSNNLHVGYTQSTYWIYFTIKNLSHMSNDVTCAFPIH